MIKMTKIHIPASLLACTLACAVPAANAAEMEEMQSPREAAPVELTGYWTTVITEDWRWRMVTPPKGDYVSMPLNEEGIRVADSWDEEETNSCKAYGAAGLMRMPIRVHLEWEDDDTLRLESDHGEQVRYFHFNPEDIPARGPSRQGDSVAEWEGVSLRVVTTNLLPGYLRRNGVPYSGDAVVTEYYDRHASFGDEWFTVSTFVNDPTYLTEEFFTSSSFKLLPNGDDWNPVPCDE